MAPTKKGRTPPEGEGIACWRGAAPGEDRQARVTELEQSLRFVDSVNDEIGRRYDEAQDEIKAEREARHDVAREYARLAESAGQILDQFEELALDAESVEAHGEFLFGTL